MRDTPDQVARVTKELRALLMQLHWSAFQSYSSSEQNLILSGLLNTGLIELLRTTIDQFSQFFWCYVESAAANSSPEPDYELQSKRLGQITEMLRLLHRPVWLAENPLGFFDRVTQTVDRHLENASQNELPFGAEWNDPSRRECKAAEATK